MPKYHKRKKAAKGKPRKLRDTAVVKKRAKTLEPSQVKTIVATINKECTFPLRDQVMLMLGFKAGLRAQEIAYLEIDDVTDANNMISNVLHVTKRASKGVKYGRERDIPLDKEMQELLRIYREDEGIKKGPLFKTRFNEPMNPNAVEKQLGRLGKKAGFVGVSSHSGRRTFITRGARVAGQVGCSLRDVQHLAGHASLGTTEMYIELSENQHKLVDLVNADAA